MKRVTARIAAHTPVFIKEIIYFPFHLAALVYGLIRESVSEAALWLEDTGREE